MAKDFATLARDDNQVALSTGAAFATQDATGTPKTSPLAYSSVEIAITVPSNAAEMVMRPTTDMRISEVTGMARFYMIPSGTTMAFGVARTDTIFIKRDTADGNLHFYFITV